MLNTQLIGRALKTGLAQLGLAHVVWIFLWGFAWEIDLSDGAMAYVLGAAILGGAAWGQSWAVGVNGPYRPARTLGYIGRLSAGQATVFVLGDLALIAALRALTTPETQWDFAVDTYAHLPVWWLCVAISTALTLLTLRPIATFAFDGTRDSHLLDLPTEPGLMALTEMSAQLRAGASLDDIWSQIVEAGGDPVSSREMLQALCDEEPWTCEGCGEQFHPEIRICSHCGTERL